MLYDPNAQEPYYSAQDYRARAEPGGHGLPPLHYPMTEQPTAQSGGGLVRTMLLMALGYGLSKLVTSHRAARNRQALSKAQRAWRQRATDNRQSRLYKRRPW